MTIIETGVINIFVESVENLLNPILQIYEADYHSEKHLKLFHRTFILQLYSCFGLKKFLDNFPTLLIEAIGGWKVPGENDELAPRAHLTSTHLTIETLEESQNNPVPSKGPASNDTKDKFRRMESEQADGAGETVEPEMFLMEPDVSDSEEKETSAASTAQNSISIPLSTDVIQGATATANSVSTVVSANLHHSALNINDHSRNRSYSPPTLQLRRSRDTHRSTSSSRDASLGASSTSGSGSKSVADLSEMCSESVLWLSHRFGPVLCAKYLTKNLLRMLTLCFLGHIDNIEVEKRNCSMHCDGDLHAKKVLDCLIVISGKFRKTIEAKKIIETFQSNTTILIFLIPDLYGDCFIEHQYLPYCTEVVGSAVRKLNVAIEAAILGVSALLEHIFNHVSDTFLVSQLKDPILSTILTPLCRLVCLEDIVFPSDPNSSSILASKVRRLQKFKWKTHLNFIWKGIISL